MIGTLRTSTGHTSMHDLPAEYLCEMLRRAVQRALRRTPQLDPMRCEI